MGKSQGISQLLRTQDLNLGHRIPADDPTMVRKVLGLTNDTGADTIGGPITINATATTPDGTRVKWCKMRSQYGF